MSIAGRTHEINIMKGLLNSEKSEFLAIYGRRRVGKTFLIDQLYGKQMVFAMSGVHHATLNEQLQNFTDAFTTVSKQVALNVTNWLQAFQLLKQHVGKVRRSAKKVIFIDELPWLCTPKSGFLTALEHFWNSWASKRTDIVLVVCGSAANWMIQNIVSNKGGLHNRITQTIRLMPFTLYETQAMLLLQHIKLTPHQIAQVYMVTGGIPYYLSKVPRGMSVAQIINQLCYAKDGLLQLEFNYLLASLFGEDRQHKKVVEVLATKGIGLTRSDILKKTKLPNAGSTTRLLDELEESGFITRLMPLEKKSKDQLYRITDPYTLFYFKFIKGVKRVSDNYKSIANAPSWAPWQGVAFENICLYHVPQIKSKLGIAGVNSLQASWIKKGTKANSGTQIDLVVDRDDAIINICEAKFNTYPFTINKAYATKLKSKLAIFENSVKLRKSLHLVFITSAGLTRNEYYYDLLQNEVQLEDLFKDTHAII